jgi:hypothetical protein
MQCSKTFILLANSQYISMLGLNVRLSVSHRKGLNRLEGCKSNTESKLSTIKINASTAHTRNIGYFILVTVLSTLTKRSLASKRLLLLHEYQKQLTVHLQQ